MSNAENIELPVPISIPEHAMVLDVERSGMVLGVLATTPVGGVIQPSVPVALVLDNNCPVEPRDAGNV